MEMYYKSEVDTVFSSWQNDLKDLSVVDAVPKSVLEDIKNEMIDNSFCSDIYDEDTDDEVIFLYKALELLENHIKENK